MFEREFLEKFKGLNVLIVGDVMLDRYWWGSVSRISPEAPVPVVNLDNTSLVSGGAANVAANIAGLGAVPHLVGVIGDDAEGELLIEILTKENISPNSLTIIPKRPTTTKTRILAHSQQIARVDQETKSEISPDQEALVWENVSRLLSYAQVIIISDYGKGVITQNISQRLITTAKANNQLIIIDPKGKNYQKYKGATMLTPNRFEAAEVSQLTVYNQESVEKAGNQMLKDFELESVLITQGEDGMTLFHKQERAEHLTVTARNVYDVTGAGDTVVACIACAVGVRMGFLEAARFANIAAGLVVERVGTTAISRAMLDQYKSIEQ
jgi:rfaE bifunctional protein kinase chain/domain